MFKQGNGMIKSLFHEDSLLQHRNSMKGSSLGGEKKTKQNRNLFGELLRSVDNFGFLINLGRREREYPSDFSPLFIDDGSLT